ncbi:unnamed protein product, partial [Polarella glacialis]
NNSNSLGKDVARLALSLAAQLRSVRSASLRTFLIPTSSTLASAAKAAGTEFSVTAKARNGTQSLSPPRILTFQAIILAIKKDNKLPADLQTAANAFVQRNMSIQEVAPLVRVCCHSKCFQRETTRLEFHFASAASAIEDTVALACTAVGGKECFGDAPRGPLELTISNTLNSMS